MNGWDPRGMIRTRIGLVLSAFFLILLVPWRGLHGSPLPPKTPFNVLLLTVDALRPDHLSCYGYRKIETRNIDRLASRGVLFEMALSASPWTSPSIASLMTSLYPSVHGVRKGVALDSGFTTLAEILRRNGFRTHAIVTTPNLSEKVNLGQGFQGYELLGRNRFSKYFMGDDLADSVTQKAIHWLRRSGKRPFFLWLHYIDPHIPYGFPNGTVLPAYHTDYQGTMGNYFYDVEAARRSALKLTREDKEHIKALYDADILFADRHLGILWKELDRLGIEGNTIVVLTSDHGEEFWDHNGFEHGHSLYQEVIRVPLILAVPGSEGGPRRISSPVRLIDVAPTILDLLGLRWDTPVQGGSLLRLMKTGRDPFDRPPSFSEALLYGTDKKAMRKGHYTLIYEPETRRAELYDTSLDPGEQVNKAQSQRGILDGLLSDLDRWLHQCEILSGSIPRRDLRGEFDLKGHEKRLRELGYVQ